MEREKIPNSFFLGHKNPKADIKNWAILNPTHIIHHEASSAAEAEIGAVFINCKEALPILTTLHEMGFKQPPTPVIIDNTTAVGFANDTIKQKKTRAMDMRYHWLRDKETQEIFEFLWQPAETNMGDYFTKHHPPTHHQNMRQHFLSSIVFHQIMTMNFKKLKRKLHTESTARVCWYPSVPGIISSGSWHQFPHWPANDRYLISAVSVRCSLMPTDRYHSRQSRCSK